MDRIRSIVVLSAAALVASLLVPCPPAAAVPEVASAEHGAVLIAFCACHMQQAPLGAAAATGKLAIIADLVELRAPEPEPAPPAPRPLPNWLEPAHDVDPPPPRRLS